MRNENQANRRDFIKTSALTAGALALPRFSIAEPGSANGRINIAVAGAGGMGEYAVKLAATENFVAICDVDEMRAGEAREAHPEVPFFKDFRVMLDKMGKEIDAVAISTPDHTHHCIAKWCLEAGKPIYLEKPLTHNIAEARDLIALEKKTGLACQMGNQGHSGSGILMLEVWVKAGVFGEVREAHAWAGPLWSVEDKRPAPEPVPEELDWDLWLGPAAKVPYSSRYLPASWRGWFEFGCGTLGDWACHNMDAPYSVFGLDCPSRVEIESSGPKKLSFPKSAKITFTFPAVAGRPEFKLCWYHGPKFPPPRPPEMEPGKKLPSGGTMVVGSKTTAVMGTHAGIPHIVPAAKFLEMRKRKTLPRPNVKRSSHWDNWLRAIRGEETCRSNFAYGGRLTESILFGNIALHVNRNLTIDPKTRTIVGDAQAQAMVGGPEARRGW